MSYRVMADLIVVFHLAVVVFVIAGGLLLLWRRWVAWVHLPVVAWVIFAECFQRMCPLTFLENSLRDRGGGEAYQGDFVSHYIVPVLYPDGLTWRIQVALGIAIFVINVVVYAIAFGRKASPPPQGRSVGHSPNVSPH
jgi:hypothetical protein